MWTAIAQSGWAIRGLNPDAGEIFRICPYRPWSSPSLLYNVHQVSFLGEEGSGRGVKHPAPCSAEVKERVELYLYPPSGLLCPVLGRTWPLLLNHSWRLCAHYNCTVCSVQCQRCACVFGFRSRGTQFVFLLFDNISRSHLRKNKTKTVLRVL